MLTQEFNFERLINSIPFECAVFISDGGKSCEDTTIPSYALYCFMASVINLKLLELGIGDIKTLFCFNNCFLSKFRRLLKILSSPESNQHANRVDNFYKRCFKNVSNSYFVIESIALNEKGLGE